jgi:biotin-(acetyl-CoA carboxylase) ligase
MLASVIVGIGVNVRALSFPEPLDRVATSLTQLGVSGARLDRSELAADLVARILVASQRFASHGLAEDLADLRALDALQGRPIVVGNVRGVAAGIDERGRLLVRDATGAVHPITAGHVELA